MVKRCCVSTCRNGRVDNNEADEEDERVSYFKVPSEQSLFEKWAEAIGQKTGSTAVLDETSAICERHFRDDEMIRKESVLRDSCGNVIFQKPLTEFSLVKEAIPSIFDENLDEQTPLKKRRKRKTVIPDYTGDILNTAFLASQGNLMIANEGNFNMNYSNILFALNESQNNLFHFDLGLNNSQSLLIPTDDAKGDGQNYENNLRNLDAVFDATSNIIKTFYINGNGSLYSNGFNNPSDTRIDQNQDENSTAMDNEPKSITIYIKPQDDSSKSSVNNVENITTNGAFNSIDTSLISKEQITEKLPNQFNDLNGLNSQAPKEVTIIVPEEEIMILSETNNYTLNNNVQTNEQSKLGTIHYPLPESDIQKNIRSFDLIFYNSHKIKLPNPMWGYHKNSIDKDIIIFSKAKWFKSDVLIPPIYEKQVIFHESDDIKIYINNKFSPLEVRRPKDVQEIELILKHVDETIVCSGGPNTGECDTAHCAQKDYAVNRWRHKLCPIIVAEGETICKFCSTINQVLRYPKKKRLAFGRRSAVKQDS